MRLRLRLAAALIALPLAAHAGPRPAKADLTGLWTSASLTMLERPESVPKRIVPEAEAATYERRVMAADGADSDDVGGRSSEFGFWNFGGRFARIDGQVRASWIVDPDDGRLPFRPEGLAARARDLARHQDLANPETRTPSEQCLLTGWAGAGPPMLNAPYANAAQIVQTKDTMAIALEAVHDVRIVPLVEGPAAARHMPAALRRWMGDSVGWWEGSTLVVETVNFNPGDAVKFPTSLYVSPRARVTERFSKMKDGRLRYAFAVDDPDIYARPWRAEMVFNRIPGALIEYACHEGNYSLPGMLAGARREEAQAKLPARQP
jgi:hypothetical protein